MTTPATPDDHTGHRSHWDADGTGDSHCSEHQEPGCACLPWPDEPDPYDERRAAEREDAYMRAHQDDAPPEYQGVEL